MYQETMNVSRNGECMLLIAGIALWVDHIVQLRNAVDGIEAVE